MKRKWFQIHLLTLVVIVNSIAALLLLNTRSHEWERIEGTVGSDSEIVHYYHRTIGWPFYWEWQFPESGLAEHGYSPHGHNAIRFGLTFQSPNRSDALKVSRADMQVLKLADLRGNISNGLFAMALNIAFGLALLLTITVFCEHLLRRREAHKP